MIRLTKPELSGVLESLGKLLDSGFLVQGEKVCEFESWAAGYVGRRHALAVNSGTAAIQCAVMGLGIGHGDEVALPDFTFPATANAVVLAGARPVLVDIDPATFNMDPSILPDRLTEAARAVMPVDLFGLAADLDTIGRVCDRKDLMLIEDSACALGAMHRGSRCGAFGDASALSFHPRKILTTGEGGMVLTDSDSVAGRIRELRNHGIRVENGKPEFVVPGYNFRMNEIEAVLGLAQMEHFDDLIGGRRQVAGLYGELLAGVEGLVLPAEPEGYFHTYQSYVVMTDDCIDRDLLIDMLRKRGIESGIGTYALHVQPYYRDLLGHRPGDFPNSFRALKQSLSLPMYPSMAGSEVEQVAEALKACIPGASAGK
jgi:dTDP-4-amino-4,6-dideoxygalactose transaminase